MSQYLNVRSLNFVQISNNVNIAVYILYSIELHHLVHTCIQTTPFSTYKHSNYLGMLQHIHYHGLQAPNRAYLENILKISFITH